MLRFCLTLLAAVPVSTLAAGQAFDPPPVDEAALAMRLAGMTRPGRGERAIILYDPTYYPGITTRLREELHRRGVFTYVLVEETPAIIESYVDDETRHTRQEQDAIAALEPLFARRTSSTGCRRAATSTTSAGNASSSGRASAASTFTGCCRFRGTGPPSRSRRNQPHWSGAHWTWISRIMRGARTGMAAAMRGRTLRITTPAGTDLIVGVPDDQWFHLGNGDASRDRAARARSIRDREIELPVGMFNFVPHAPRVEGVLVADTILRAGPDVRGARLVLRRGRVVQAEAREGLESIHRAFRRIGPDGEKVATVWLDTHPLTERYGLRVELGSNWENGGRNRATGARRLAIALPDATVTADGVAILKDGRILWESISGGRWAVGSGQSAVGGQPTAYRPLPCLLPTAHRLPPTP